MENFYETMLGPDRNFQANTAYNGIRRAGETQKL